MKLLLLLLISAAVVFAFWLAGYATGKIRRRSLSILFVVITGAFPAILLLFVRAFKPIAIVTVLWLALYVIAGHIMAKKTSPFWVACARTAVCVLVLIQFTSIAVEWTDETHWLDAARWHRANSNRAQIGSWQFNIPDAWYPIYKTGFLLRRLGARDVLELQRASLSADSSSSVILIAAPFSVSSTLGLDKTALAEDKRFQVQGEFGQCSYSGLEERNPPFKEQCRFPRADLYIEIEARTEDELLEVERIISGARFLKTSDPNAIRQSS